MQENPERRSLYGIVRSRDGAQPPGMNRILFREDQARILERCVSSAVLCGGVFGLLSLVISGNFYLGLGGVAVGGTLGFSVGAVRAAIGGTQ